ncbi:mannonate dehydratase [Chelativorans sp. SCAU2101]|uniref:Mannonate dehydratase n=1 Tax=Chelativorans petroleitrophicus TaxID=2975484 RepID=A0A9X3BAD9_9HYPH|nr:mannonate dehydratase [Chelativorans petroleitrophicus]MCT8991836.1 mannonate dehydratase [Chelativorans petroleitrophicus]
MRQTWRWFGPQDLVSIDDIRQAGAEGVVSALHHVPSGAVWTPEEIEKRQREVATAANGQPSGLAWEVVESLPVSEDIKKQKNDWREHIANYRTSLRNLAAAGIKVVCYNFMPVLDWTRTDLAWRLPHGGTCMRFDLVDFAAFDIGILKRPGASEDFPPEIVEEANRRLAEMDATRKNELARNIAFGLPGAAEHLTMDDLRAHLEEYGATSPEQLRNHFIAFLEEVVPTAEEVGIRLCCHPDDPPFQLLGLPRIMSTEADYATIMNAVDSPANGITLCSGSLGARPDNDLPGMMRRLGSRVHFLHLRNVKRETANIAGSFYEAEHLGGDTDMVALIAEILKEEERRRAAGREDHSIPMRPDHGQDILDDLKRKAQPGYPAVGRLRGLAELRGIITALSHPEYGLAE